jgi:hypothetical protein
MRATWSTIPPSVHSSSCGPRRCRHARTACAARYSSAATARPCVTQRVRPPSPTGTASADDASTARRRLPRNPTGTRRLAGRHGLPLRPDGDAARSGSGAGASRPTRRGRSRNALGERSRPRRPPRKMHGSVWVPRGDEEHPRGGADPPAAGCPVSGTRCRRSDSRGNGPSQARQSSPGRCRVQESAIDPRRRLEVRAGSRTVPHRPDRRDASRKARASLGLLGVGDPLA